MIKRSDRTYTSTMFKALSSEYSGRVLIGEARKSEWNVFQQYGPESIPALLQVWRHRAPASSVLCPHVPASKPESSTVS